METETTVRIFAARNMPQSSETQRHERQAALQLALRAAAEVPLEVMRLCGRGLKYAATVARYSSHVASADVQLAIGLLETAFHGARTNLEAKLGIVADAGYVMEVINEIARLTEEAGASARAAQSHLQIPPA
jgi:formiminotetrahydrofolate cyclodeaminase